MDQVEHQSLLEAIGSLTRTVAALQGDMKDMGTAIAKIEASQGSPAIQNAESASTQEEAKDADLGQAEEHEPDHFVPESILHCAPEQILLGKVHDEASQDLVKSWLAEHASTPTEALEMEELLLDPGQGKEQVLIEDVPAFSLDVDPGQEEQGHSHDEADRSELDSCLAVRLNSAGDVLENALSELRLILDQRDVAVDPDQHERLSREIATVQADVTTLAAVAQEIRTEICMGREAMASALPPVFDDLNRLIVEQHQAVETSLAEIACNAQNAHEATQLAVSEGTSSLARHLDEELAKLRAQFTALQDSVGQTGLRGLKSKVIQTWAASLFGLTMVILYIVIRSFWG